MNEPSRSLTLFAAILAALVAIPACAQDGDDAAAAHENADAEATAADSADDQTWDQKASYALGVNIGDNLAPDDLDLDAELLRQGFLDALKSAETMESDEIDAVLSELGAKMQRHADDQRQAALFENTARGAAFLADKAKEEGVVKTASGLLYRELRAGSGESPAADQSVSVHYRGTLIDGSVFDSSYDRGEPTTFPVGGVIAGWSEALQLMKPGAKWELFIPTDLGYGDSGSAPDIPPGAALIFEVELLEVVE